MSTIKVDTANSIEELESLMNRRGIYAVCRALHVREAHAYIDIEIENAGENLLCVNQHDMI